MAEAFFGHRAEICSASREGVLPSQGSFDCGDTQIFLVEQKHIFLTIIHPFYSKYCIQETDPAAGSSYPFLPNAFLRPVGATVWEKPETERKNALLL